MQLEHVRSDFDLRSLGRIVWRRKIAIITCVAVLVGLQLFISLRKTPVYVARSQILVSTSGNPLIQQANGVNDPIRALENESRIITSAQVKDLVEKETGRRLSVSASPSEKSDIVELSAAGSDPEVVADTVNRYAQAYVVIRQRLIDTSSQKEKEDITSAITELEKKLGALDIAEADLSNQITAATGDPQKQGQLAQTLLQLRQTNETQRTAIQSQLANLRNKQNLSDIVSVVSSAGKPQADVTILSYASVPKVPVSPNPVRDALLAATAGLLIGIVIAYVREQTEDHVRGRLDLEADFPQVPVLTAIPTITGIGKRDVVTEVRSTSPAAEAFRKLRTSLEFLALTQRLSVVQITSASANEGKTSTSINLAAAVAQSGQRVALVCADFRIPRVHEYMGISNDVGLTSVLLGSASLSDAIHPTRIPDLYLLPAGPVPPNPSELLDSERAHEVVELLSARFDLVILDTPPILPVTDPLVTATMSDATIVVVRSRQSRRRQLRRALETLEQLDIPVAGIVLNDETADEAHAYGYGYGYYGRSYGREQVEAAARDAARPARNGSSADVEVDVTTNGATPEPAAEAEVGARVDVGGIAPEPDAPTDH